MNIVLGSRGRLGRAVSISLPKDQITTPPRPTYAEWWRDGAADDVSRFLQSLAKREGTVYVATGLIDPSRLGDEHHKVNYLLARNVVEGATKLGFKVVTFGTVMEDIVNEKTTNPYLESKIRLGHFVNDFSTNSDLVLHIKMHTLFGGVLPDGFMFLGQVFNSLLNRSEFRMSHGTQLREYHHVDDDVAAIKQLLKLGASGSVTLTHGEPVTLKSIAVYIFEAFNCLDLLKIGEFSGPVHDNYDILFERPNALESIKFRTTSPALVNYLRSCDGLLARDSA